VLSRPPVRREQQVGACDPAILRKHQCLGVSAEVVMEEDRGGQRECRKQKRCDRRHPADDDGDGANHKGRRQKQEGVDGRSHRRWASFNQRIRQ
jgi:hypothetical protein